MRFRGRRVVYFGCCASRASRTRAPGHVLEAADSRNPRATGNAAVRTAQGACALASAVRRVNVGGLGARTATGGCLSTDALRCHWFRLVHICSTEFLAAKASGFGVSFLRVIRSILSIDQAVDSQPRSRRARRPSSCVRLECSDVARLFYPGTGRGAQLSARLARPGFTAHGNDPYAGSPTKTLLRLLLPRSDQVRLTFRSRRDAEAPGAARSPWASLNHSIGSSDGRCVQRAGTDSPRADDSQVQGIPR